MTRLVFLLAVPALLISLLRPGFTAGSDWALYGGEGGRRFSTLTQISPAKFARLQQSWRVCIGGGGGPPNPPPGVRRGGPIPLPPPRPHCPRWGPRHTAAAL